MREKAVSWQFARMMNQFRWIIPFAGGMLSTLTAATQSPAPPEGVAAIAYESHIELEWLPGSDPAVASFQIFRSTDNGQNYFPLKTVGTSVSRMIDWTADEGQTLTRHYRIKAVRNDGAVSDFSAVASATTHTMTDDELLEMVQRATFRYFWDYGHPVSGLARERNNGDPDVVTTGGSGFGIMALLVGAERGWVSRSQAIDRMINIVSFLQFADRFHGVFPHWMNGNNGNVIPFSQYDNGADLVETAFLMQGLLAARVYFNGDTPLEKALRSAITGLWEDVEWDWFRRNGGPVLYWHWSPNYEWKMNFALRGFFEAQIVYILAAASPTHPVPGSLYQSGWTSMPGYCTSNSYYGYKPYCGGYGGGPMFFAHYSYLGFDPRGWKDACCNYFARNRNHALLQWNYAQLNPEKHIGYGANCWGLTACDGPNGYSAHDVFPTNDEGTVAPTAALASMPYAPEQSLEALKHFYRDLGDRLWGLYGFYDSFNQDLNWVASSYLAIDQGPIVGMIENHRTRLLWDLFMQNPEIEPALLACGFQRDSSVGMPPEPIAGLDLRVYPNPAATGQLTLVFDLEQPAIASAVLVDLLGKPVRRFFESTVLPAGASRVNVSLDPAIRGLYLLRLTDGQGRILTRKILINN